MLKFDQDIMLKLVSELRKSVRRLNNLSTLKKEELFGDPDKIASAKYHFIVAIESCIDMCNHIISQNSFRVPEDYADTFRVISLSFSNLGGPEVIDEYFSANGHRPYADKIYGNLGEFYFSKLRYEDAASVYKSFINLNPYHRVSPHFSMRIVEIYGEAGFPKLVVESKKEFATRYAVDAEYWHRFDIEDSPEVVGFLKTNLSDLANHYHALYQEPVFEDEQPQNFAEASRWYRQFLYSFPSDEETPQINYQLADLLLENRSFGDAADAERCLGECGREISLPRAFHAAGQMGRRGIVILGDPGSGKTTHLKRLLLWCLGDVLSEHFAVVGCQEDWGQ